MSKILASLENRRSHYALSKESGVSDEEVTKIVKRALDLTPSAFNAQTQRAVVLFGENSDTFWDLTREALREVAPAEGFDKTIAKLETFKAGQGTILYYIDTAVVKGLQEQFALYADNFPTWAQQENGMLQLVVWSALADAGLGASLQHYNPVVDAAAAKAFDIPESWTLVAQAPFGKPAGDVNPKETIPAEEKIKVF